MVYVSVYCTELDCWLSYPLPGTMLECTVELLAVRLLDLASDDLAEAA